MITLDLSDVLVPDIIGYTPEIGTKVVRDAQNLGGLSTQQVTENVARPFIKQRPVQAVSSDTTTKVNHDARIDVEVSGVTVSLGEPGFSGVLVTVCGKFPEGTAQVSAGDLAWTLSAGETAIFRGDPDAGWTFFAGTKNARLPVSQPQNIADGDVWIS